MVKVRMDTNGFKRELRKAVEQQANQLVKESGRALQREVDAVYNKRADRSIDEIKADLESRLRRLDFRFEAGEMEEWARAISEGDRVVIQVKGNIRS